MESFSGGGTSQDVACLRLRGLPFSATEAQLREFFGAYSLLDLLITRSEGKPNGQAFVVLPKSEALQAKVELNNRYLGKRFIEIFSATMADMETARRMSAEPHKSSSGSFPVSSQRAKQQAASNLHIIRLRGLPFSATPADIKAFLAATELPDGIYSIQMVCHPDLRPTGEAYVHLNTETEVMQALNKHKQMMGKRYIEVFPSCLAELQQSMTPPRPMGFQHADQGYAQNGNTAQGADLAHAPAVGAGGMPTSCPTAQAAWLARQQQLLQLQQQMQLQAAAQQKMLSTLQQPRQAATLRVQAQLQAQAQVLPTMLQQMQLSDVGSGAQQDTLVTVQGMPGVASPQQSQHVLLLNGLQAPAVSMCPPVAHLHSGSIAPPVAVAAGSASGGLSLSSNLASSVSGYHASYGLMAGPAPGGLSHTAAAAATATCSPSPLDVQYVPYFCSANQAPMTALMLHDTHGLQPGSLQMISPSCTVLPNPVGVSCAPQPLFAGEVLSSSANAVDGTLLPGSIGAGIGGAGPAAFCSDPVMLQGVRSGPLAGVAQSAFMRVQGLGRASVQQAAQEWLS